MLEYFLVICMFTVTDKVVHCAEPLERRGPYPSEQLCVEANQALGLELGLDQRANAYIAMCDAIYRDKIYATDSKGREDQTSHGEAVRL